MNILLHLQLLSCPKTSLSGPPRTPAFWKYGPTWYRYRSHPGNFPIFCGTGKICADKSTGAEQIFGYRHTMIVTLQKIVTMP